MRWFNTAGTYKGTLIVTDVRPVKRERFENCYHLKKYLDLMKKITDVSSLVFTDEKPMKELMIYLKTRRDIKKGTVPKILISSTAKIDLIFYAL